jgi:Flp pilus assembly protein TadG
MPLLLLLLALVMVLAAVIVRVGGRVADRSHVEHAADAAALAGAVGGRTAAASVARANDVELVDFVEAGDVVTVAVRSGPDSATARAELVVSVAG